MTTSALRLVVALVILAPPCASQAQLASVGPAWRGASWGMTPAQVSKALSTRQGWPQWTKPSPVTRFWETLTFDGTGLAPLDVHAKNLTSISVNWLDDVTSGVTAYFIDNKLFVLRVSTNASHQDVLEAASRAYGRSPASERFQVFNRLTNTSEPEQALSWVVGETLAILSGGPAPRRFGPTMLIIHLRSYAALRDAEAPIAAKEAQKQKDADAAIKAQLKF